MLLLSGISFHNAVVIQVLYVSAIFALLQQSFTWQDKKKHKKDRVKGDDQPMEAARPISGRLLSGVAWQDYGTTHMGASNTLLSSM